MLRFCEEQYLSRVLQRKYFQVPHSTEAAAWEGDGSVVGKTADRALSGTPAAVGAAPALEAALPPHGSYGGEGHRGTAVPSLVS